MDHSQARIDIVPSGEALSLVKVSVCSRLLPPHALDWHICSIEGKMANWAVGSQDPGSQKLRRGHSLRGTRGSQGRIQATFTRPWSRSSEARKGIFNREPGWCMILTGWCPFGSQHHDVQALSAAMKVERRLAQRIKGSSAAAGVRASDTSRKHGNHLGCTCHLWNQCRPVNPASCHVRCWEPSVYVKVFACCASIQGS